VPDPRSAASPQPTRAGRGRRALLGELEAGAEEQLNVATLARVYALGGAIALTLLSRDSSNGSATCWASATTRSWSRYATTRDSRESSRLRG
jgi:hypothetical protein